ncbi:permease-like cell division protein FtsX [Syntrophomonas palmitatica]|uniref:permease-like cell division protein FtsX n=1 Tax=Syntrophomonas palmitatica TaxID=402877 RepID=UPI0006D15893|nr:permease-like cell division protein FtsX [Syntrophomonas palmitatica]
MNPGSLFYFVREAGKSLSRNRLLSFATVSTVAISILILGFALLVTINTTYFMEKLESDVEIIAFLDKSLTPSQISDVKTEIKDIPGVKSVNFVSRDEALEKMQKSFGGREYDLKSTLGKNPLPHSYRIKAGEPEQVPKIAARVKKVHGVYKVNYGQGVVERLFKITSWIRIISLIFIILLIFGAVFLIATTIRLAIFARRKEIYLMKLVGSTDWFVRWPFFIEGVTLAALGSIISVAILSLSYGSLIKKMGSLFFIPLVTDAATLSHVYLGLLITGALLGVIGTWISLNRFLKV